MNASQFAKARQLVESYSCVEPKIPASETEKEELRQAVKLMVERSDAENLGVCAENSHRGYQALANYLQALGYNVPFAIAALETVAEPVYIKFNTSKMTHYLDSYSGEYRGVLISCQSEEDEVNGTYGHFPLDLFDD